MEPGAGGRPDGGGGMNPPGGRISGLIIGTRTGSIPGGGGGIRIPTQHTQQLATCASQNSPPEMTIFDHPHSSVL